MLASLLDEEPGNLKASHEYARVLLNRGMFRRADSVLGLLKHHSPHTLLLAARTSLGLGQVDRAQSFLRQVVDTASRRGIPYLRAG
jgi:hypothetical protein